MNTTRMMILSEYLTFSIRSISLIFLLTVCFQTAGKSQNHLSSKAFVPQSYSLKSAIDANSQNDTNQNKFPDPKLSLRRSLILPGWGQVTNNQIWKVPIVYGVLGGLTYYSINLHKRYHDYRAAYYNLHPDTPDDLRFGDTPGYIDENSSLQLVKENRNFYRNRRDLMYVLIGVSYALNAIDAYVFAHLRSFDVSDDLSFKASIEPRLVAMNKTKATPMLSLSIKF